MIQVSNSTDQQYRYNDTRNDITDRMLHFSNTRAVQVFKFAARVIGRCPKATFVALVLSVLVAILIGITMESLAFMKRYEAIAAFPGKTNRPLIPRSAGKHIRQRAAGRHHMIVGGPTGVGKTMATKQAFDNNETIDGINTPTMFLSFYVDLQRFVVPASHDGSARVIECGTRDIGTSSIPPAFDRAARVDAAFTEAAESFENRVLASMHRDIAGMLLELMWRALWTLELVLPMLATPSAPASGTVVTPSITRHLQRFMNAASYYRLFLRYSSFWYGSRGCIPVLIVDEVHLLDASDLSVIRHEFVAFLFKHASAKSMAPVVLVLLSSDATASRILKSCGCFAIVVTSA